MKFLFDLGGVFFDWDPNYFYKNVFETDDEREFFLSEVCNDSWNLKQDLGRTIIEAESNLIPKFPKYEKEIKMYYSNHRNMIKGIFKESIAVLNYLKKNKYECFVLSNWSAETFYGPQQSMIEDYPFLNLFDGLLISGQEKLIKPDPAIYQLAIDRFNLNPKGCVFIDDKLENVEAAKKLNFHVIHLTDAKNIENNIKSFLK